MVKSEVIDGLAGDLHVTAEQIVDVNIGTYGGDDYVISTGQELAAELISNNKLRIFDGVMVYGGIRDVVSVNEYHDVTIENGSQGMNRNDIVVRHYVKDEVTEYVSAEFIVIKGTPVDGTAVDPEVDVTDIRAGALTHDMKLYRVKLEGLNVVAVEPLFDVLMPMSKQQAMIAELNRKLAYIKTDISSNLKVYREERRITVQGLVLLNGSSTTFDLPYTAIDATRFPAIGLSNNLTLSGYGFGTVQGTTCAVAITNAVTYAAVNFTYYTNL